MTSDSRLVLVGGGNMGGALLRGVLSAGLWTPERVTVVDVDVGLLSSLRGYHGVMTSTDTASAVRGADVAILAVKPFILPEVLAAIAPVAKPGLLVISVVAGVEIAAIRAALGSEVSIVRCMPNLPATVGAGATAVSPAEGVGTDDIARVERILGAVGSVVRVDESRLDAVTGLSGSGPAYVFLVIEALADGGVRMGLPRDVAITLATQTVLGAARLVAETGEHPAVLKDRVSTPAGTTIEGLQALEDHGVRAAFGRAVEAATERARELGRAATR